ncbi:hypothetical protein ACLOJK_030001 [Asimina triloba]
MFYTIFQRLRPIRCSAVDGQEKEKKQESAVAEATKDLVWRTWPELDLIELDIDAIDA